MIFISRISIAVFIAITITACGAGGGGASSGGGVTAYSDKCFGLAGRYTDGAFNLYVSSTAYQYCVVYSDYCGETVHAPRKNGDGSYETTGWQGVRAHAECPGAGNSTCRIDIIGANMVMDCGLGSKNYGSKL